MANSGWSCCQKVGRHIQTAKDSLSLHLPSRLERAITGHNRAGALLGAEDDQREGVPRSVVRGQVPEFIY